MVLEHTGHIRRPDGAVIRLDIESGIYVARYYAPDRQMKARVIGSLGYVQSAMKHWS